MFSLTKPGCAVGPRKGGSVTAVFLMVGSALSFAFMGAAVKGSTIGMPFLVSLLFRSFPGIIPLGIYLLLKCGTLGSPKQDLLFRRSLLGFSAMFLFFFAIERLPLSTAVILNQSSPVFTVIFSAILLREHRAIHVFPLALLAFLGVGVLVGPDIADTGIEVSFGLASAVLAALAYVTVKQLSATVSSPVIVFYFSVWGTVFSLIAIGISMLFGFGAVDMPDIAGRLSDPKTILVLLSISMFGVLGQLLMTASYARARASLVSPFGFFNPLFSYVIGVSVFDENLSLNKVIGGILVVVASSLVPFVSSRKT